jgi:hypothetical protein
MTLGELLLFLNNLPKSMHNNYVVLVTKDNFFGINEVQLDEQFVRLCSDEL